MDGHVASSPVTLGELAVTSYAPQPLGGYLMYSVRDLAKMTSTPIECVFCFWVALGLQVPTVDNRVFSQCDLEAFSHWHDPTESGGIDTATPYSLLHASAHLVDRLALWQFEALVEDSMHRLMLDDTTVRTYVLNHVREYVDTFQEILIYVRRRQLEATLSRFDCEVSQRGHEKRCNRFPPNRYLDSVDTVSYTLPSTIPGDVLVGFIERPEEGSRSAVTEEGGRVVKIVGDTVLYTADDLPTGLCVAAALTERLNADDEILLVRTSFVHGDISSWSGNTFGPTMSLAPHLVDIAPMDEILTDPTTAAVIAVGEVGDGHGLGKFPTADLCGFSPVSPYLLLSVAK